MNMYRDLHSIPVLAKAGAILPFTDEISAKEAIKNPSGLRVKVYAGADGSFTLYEDDNETCGYEKDDCVKTSFTYTETNSDAVEFVVKPAQGNLSLIPTERSYVIELHGFEEPAKEEVLMTAEEVNREKVTVTVDGEVMEAKISYDSDRHTIVVQVSEVEVTKEIKIRIGKNLIKLENNVKETCFKFLNQAEIEFFLKDQIYGLIQKEKRLPILISRLHTMNLEEKLLGGLMEILTAKVK